MHDTLASKGRVQYDPYAPEQQYEMQLIAQAYLTGKTEDIETLNSVRQVNELLSQMRNLFRKLKQDGQNLLTAEETMRSDLGNAAQEELKRRNTMLQADGVGEVEDAGQFGLGLAPRESKPVTKIELSKEKEEEIARMNEYEEA